MQYMEKSHYNQFILDKFSRVLYYNHKFVNFLTIKLATVNFLSIYYKRELT